MQTEKARTTITLNTHLMQKEGWTSLDMTDCELHDLFTQHREIVVKDDAPVFMPAILRGPRRVKPNVSALTELVLDLDMGEPLEPVRAKIAAMGRRAFIHSTHSHMNTRTEVPRDAFLNHAQPHGIGAGGAEAFLKAKGYAPYIYEGATAELVGEVVVISHGPIEKYRVVFPLEEPFALEGDVETAVNAWKAFYTKAAAAIGVTWDGACADVTRAFFLPSCKPGAERYAEAFEGRRLSPCEFHVEDSPAPLDLKAWISRFGATFELETALRLKAPGHIFRSVRNPSGAIIQCPFEHTHTIQGGNGTFVINASENDGRGFGAYCSHNHCLTERGNGTKIDRIIFIEKMLEHGWLTAADLTDRTLGGGPIVPSRDRGRPLVDADGVGIDPTAYYENHFAVPGAIDLERLSARAGVEIGPAITIDDLERFIRDNTLTVADLVDASLILERDAKADDYRVCLIGLAKQLAWGKLTRKSAANEIKALRKRYDVNQKAVEADLKSIEAELQSDDFRNSIGILSDAEACLIDPMNQYADRYCIIKLKSKVVFLDKRAPEPTEGLVGKGDLLTLHSKEWLTSKNGERIQPAREFVRFPPKHTEVYPNGFVFKPSGEVMGAFNLYKGLKLAPDASGSASMVYDLMNEVWAPGEPDAAMWALEWLMHILSHPGQKVRTCLALRGGQGEGKSILFEQLMKPILGNMLLRVTNQNMVLGDYNEAIAGKLLTVFEEAAFAKDRAAFDKMKDLVTGETVAVNPKHQAPFTIDNFSRLVVLSNHAHFVNLEGDDRRYTVLETTPAWGSDKFEQLVHQLNNGGRERFLYDALNHEYKTLDDGHTRLIQRNLKTEASVRQKAESRTSLQRVLVAFLLTGTLEYHHGSDACGWQLDAPLNLESQEILKEVSWRLGQLDPMAAKQLTLHSTIAELGRLVGATKETRPKGIGADKRRVQLPTKRILPPRREALDYARGNGAITEDEYCSAGAGRMDNSAVPTKIAFK